MAEPLRPRLFALDLRLSFRSVLRSLPFAVLAGALASSFLPSGVVDFSSSGSISDGLSSTAMFLKAQHLKNYNSPKFKETQSFSLLLKNLRIFRR